MSDQRIREAWRALAHAGDLEPSEIAAALATVRRVGAYPLHGAWCRLATAFELPGGTVVRRELVNCFGAWWRLRTGADRYWPTVGPPSKRTLRGGKSPTTWDGDKGTDWFQFESARADPALSLLLDWLSVRLVELHPHTFRPDQ